ncbi:MAG: hypothetical protein Gyms2KO_35820 [Gymnodinialimonas sp.]
MRGNFLIHLAVMGLGGGDVDFGQATLAHHAFGKGGFAAGGTTKNKAEGGQAQFYVPTCDPNG